MRILAGKLITFERMLLTEVFYKFFGGKINHI